MSSDEEVEICVRLAGFQFGKCSERVDSHDRHHVQQNLFQPQRSQRVAVYDSYFGPSACYFLHVLVFLFAHERQSAGLFDDDVGQRVVLLVIAVDGIENLDESWFSSTRLQVMYDAEVLQSYRL